ncbi:MAG: PIG-L family deacetylase [Candidatus Omnitrophica bacterium]|nr:PIG-L family deacetylase [Candidatus Omnitrophota bacterium]
MKRKILIIAAHPDDEILGCGGSAARFVAEGNEVSTLILGEGITSRDQTRRRELRKKDLKKLKTEVYDANNAIGVKNIFLNDFPDNRFDTMAFLDIVKVIEKVKDKISPDTLYTHCRQDLNIDHRITYQAVLTACRPLQGETVKEIYSFEVPSSTEWNYPYAFSPNIFITIDKSIQKKLDALRCYSSEIRDFPHPRSLEAVKVNARRWGSVAGVSYAEAFELIRSIQ